MTYNIQQEVTVDLDEVKKFVESIEYTRFLLENAPTFETAAFVLQSALDAIDAAAGQIDN